MPITPIRIRPGVNTQATPTLLEGGITSSNLIRWKDKLWQKLGGWSLYYPFTIGSIARALHAWEGLSDDLHLGVGAEGGLIQIEDGTGHTITPQTNTSNHAVNFSTTNGSATVTIVDSGSNTSVYDTVYIQTPVSIGGIVLQGAYPIISVIGVNSYTITAASSATSTVANGGAVPSFATINGSSTVSVTLNNHGKAVGDSFSVLVSTTVGGITLFGLYNVFSVTSANVFTIIGSSNATSTTSGSENSGNARLVYYITIGPLPAGSGYGILAYGAGGYGTGAASSSGTGAPITATDWTLDNWGETLVACPVNGPIYYWTPRSGFSNARVVTTGPFINTGIFVAMPQQILVAYGSEGTIGYGVQDPLIVRWSDVGNFTGSSSWFPTTQNQAGSYRLSSGSRIVGALQGPTVAYIFTDIDVWTMTYIGYPGVFGFLKISSGSGMISQAAAGVIGASVYWMGSNQFYVANGGSMQGLPCTVWDAVFQDLDTDNSYKIRCGINSMFDEVTWYYPSLSGGTGENDKYVKYNVRDNLWDIGSLVRTAWIDQSVLGPPIGADDLQFIYQHETSSNANGQPMNWFIQTGYFMLSDGDPSAYSDMVIPDFRYGDYADAQSATVLVTVQGIDYPSDSVVSKGPYTMTSSTQYFTARIRKRQLSLLIQGGDLNSFVRQGNLRVRIKAAGRRP